MRAFTIVEVLLSIAILSIGAVLVMQALARGAHAVAAADARTTVYSFAAAKLADLEVGSAQGLIPRTTGHFTAGGTAFQWDLDVLPPASETDLQRTTLTVRWSQAGHPQEESFSVLRRPILEPS